METLLSWILGKHWMLSVPVAGFLILAFLTPFGKLWKNDEDRRRWSVLLIQNGGRKRDNRVMRGWLDGIDERLSSPKLKAQRGAAVIAWSVTLLQILMLLAVAYPDWLRRSVVSKLESGGNGRDTDGWLGSMAVCAMIVTSIWVPVLLLYGLATANHGWLLQQVIAWFKAYATWIGAI